MYVLKCVTHLVETGDICENTYICMLLHNMMQHYTNMYLGKIKRLIQIESPYNENLFINVRMSLVGL